MKARPFLLGAFLFASLCAAGESVVVLDRVGRMVSARLDRAGGHAALSNVTRFAEGVARAFVGLTKP